MNEIWSIFTKDIMDEKSKKLVTKITLYKGDLSTVDLENDWRFSIIKGKRENVSFLGLITDPIFPLTILKNG